MGFYLRVGFSDANKANFADFSLEEMLVMRYELTREKLKSFLILAA